MTDQEIFNKKSRKLVKLYGNRVEGLLKLVAREFGVSTEALQATPKVRPKNKPSSR